MRTSFDDGTPAPGRARFWQPGGRRLQRGGSRLPLARRQPGGAGGGRRVELRHVATCHGSPARKRRRVRLIVDSIPAFAWYAGTDGKIEYLNQRILDFTRGTTGGPGGFGWANVLHPEDVERTTNAWLHSIETRRAVRCGPTCAAVRYIYRWFRTNAQLLRDRSGRVIRWYGVANDIEDLKRAEEDFASANRICA